MQPSPFVPDGFLKQLFDQSTDLIQGITLDHNLAYISPSCCTLLKRPPQELLGQPYYAHIFKDDVVPFQQALNQLIHEQIPLDLQYRYVQAGGSLIWLESKGTLIHIEHNLAGVGLITRDISQHKSIVDNLTELAYYDVLTALPNRRLFYDRYLQSLQAAKRYQRNMALLYLDLDDFKQINDNYGHEVGDELLRMIGARLSRCVRDPDTVCRLGGDEFVILLQQFEKKEDIEKVSHRVLDTISNRFVIKHHEIFITCSIGASYYPQDTMDGDELLNTADAAMYQAKKSGKNYTKL